MDISLTATDNITELLSKILEFTRRRRAVIMENILNVNTPGYEPRDLDVDEFADLMTQAISEHLHSQRLLLRDGKSVHFGREGSFETIPVADEEARLLLAADRKAYLKYQIQKLSDSLLNAHVAGGLLERKGVMSVPPELF